MDPLTHTLVGANLAATRLGERTRFAAAALILGANLPDVDSILYFTGQQDLAFGFRRGWTHGVLALVVLPFVLTGVLLLIDRFSLDRRALSPAPADGRRARRSREHADPKVLLGLSFLAIATHPVLDWLNPYGMRWLMPFRGTWSYGDSVYIMDPWLWLILGFGWLLGKRASAPLIGLWAFFAGALAWVVNWRGPEYLPVVIVVAVLLLVALLVRTQRSFATAALIAGTLYIVARLGIHAYAVREVSRELPRAERLMVGPDPIDFRHWSVIAQFADVYRYGDYRLGQGLTLDAETLPVPVDSPEYRAARAHPDVRGLVTWMRFPSYTVEGNRVTLSDARWRGWRGETVTVGPTPGSAPESTARPSR